MNEPRRKRRSFTHLMEDASLAITKEAPPNHWVIRDYKPDYGLDLSVETFSPLSDDDTVFQTHGEHFFVQLKSVTTLKSKSIKVHPRGNVAKAPLAKVMAPKSDDTEVIEVIPFRTDSALLNTIQIMGASLPVFLFLVVLDVTRLFHVCLTDYIDKIIVPENETVLEQKTVEINIPVVNELSRLEQHSKSLSTVCFFAKRAKFYSAFNLFAYQQHELQYCDDAEHRRWMGFHFIKLLRKLDIWHQSGWAAIIPYREWLSHLESVLPNLPDADWWEKHPTSSLRPDRLPFEIEPEILMDQQIVEFWTCLNSLGRLYEEVCRESALPTYFDAVCRAIS